jgi:hypothetical protein
MAGSPKQFMLRREVDDELERMLLESRGEGNRVSRSDIVGALIWEARHTDGDALGVIVRGYLRDMQRTSNSEQPDRGRPGPRPYSAAGS